jgi:hypothetical protein
MEAVRCEDENVCDENVLVERVADERSDTAVSALIRSEADKTWNADKIDSDQHGSGFRSISHLAARKGEKESLGSLPCCCSVGGVARSESDDAQGSFWLWTFGVYSY